MDDYFTSLYAIRLGQFKTHHVEADGTEQITAFHMAGDMLGTDAISNNR